MNHLKITLLALFWIGSVALVEAQPQYQTAVEEQTQILFDAERWKGLIAVGEAAVKKGLSFYELHYRLGVAYYEQSDYWQSSEHFEKALKWQPDDPILLEYLYYSYLWSNRPAAAMRVLKRLSPNQQTRIRKDFRKGLDWIYPEIGTKQSSNSDTAKNVNYGSLWLRHQVAPNLHFTHGFGYLQTGYLDTKTDQFNYFVKANYNELNATLHYQWLQGSEPAGETGDSVRIFFREDDWIFHVGASKQLNRLQIEPYVQYAAAKVRLFDFPEGDTTFQIWQVGANFQYTLPSWNNRLKILGEAAVNLRADSTRSLWRLGLDFRVNDKLTVQATYHHIGTTFFTENNAAFFTNTVGITDYKLTALVNYQVNRRLSGFAAWQFEPKQEGDFSYHFNTFLVGCKVSF